MGYKLVICIRRDLSLSPGKIAVQAAHAAVTCALIEKKKGRYFEPWYKEGQKKVVVWAENLEHMEHLASKAKALRLTAEIIKDAGLTEVPPGTATCLGIGPGPEDVINKVTGSLPLV